MREAAETAVGEIMDAGGIVTPGGTWDIELVYADTLRGKPDPDAETGAAAAMELMAADVDFVLGGFRTEATLPARDIMMDHALAYDKPIYYICGASTDGLIYAPGNAWGDVVNDYNKYRFTFRVTPTNSSVLTTAIATFFQAQVVPKLLPLFAEKLDGPQVKFAVVTEALAWADSLHYAFTNYGYIKALLGDNANLTQGYRVSPVETDFTSIVNSIKADQARLVITVISGPAGRAFITTCRDLDLDAMVVGIDVPGQEIPTHWELTGGKCEYETFLTTLGSGTPTSPTTVAFYNKIQQTYGHAPIYMAYGIYDGIRSIKELIEGKYFVHPADTTLYAALNGQPVAGHPYAGVGKWPMTADEMVPIIEQVDRPHAIMGSFKYTGPNPIGSSVYDDYMFNATHNYLQINPTMKGTLHDLFSEENGPMWFYGYPPYYRPYSRTLMGQWQQKPGEEGRLEIVAPIFRLPGVGLAPISKKFQTPDWLYELPDTDIEGHPFTPGNPAGWPLNWSFVGYPTVPFPKAFMWPSGLVDGGDMGVAIGSWQNSAGDLTWDGRADMNSDDFINVLDLAAIGMDWGKTGTIAPLANFLP